jgi:hypothetical protein
VAPGGQSETGQARRRLTQPLERVVFVLMVATAGLFFSSLINAAWDRNLIFYGFGPGSACAEVPDNGLVDSGAGSLLAHMRSGGFASYTQVLVCVAHPTAGQRALVTLARAPHTVFYVLALFLLWQLLRTVRRVGPFDVAVSRRLRFLAWFVLAGSLVVAAGQSAASGLFAASAVTDPVPVVTNGLNAVLSAVIPPLIIACGLLTLARVIRLGAEMNEDLAGTV